MNAYADYESLAAAIVSDAAKEWETAQKELRHLLSKEQEVTAPYEAALEEVLNEWDENHALLEAAEEGPEKNLLISREESINAKIALAEEALNTAEEPFLCSVKEANLRKEIADCEQYFTSDDFMALMPHTNGLAILEALKAKLAKQFATEM